jgi:hypothetical protein
MTESRRWLTRDSKRIFIHSLTRSASNEAFGSPPPPARPRDQILVPFGSHDQIRTIRDGNVGVGGSLVPRNLSGK